MNGQVKNLEPSKSVRSVNLPIGKRKKNKLTQERVKKLFDYREDGSLIWKARPAQGVQIGDIAGSLSGCGYLHVQVGGRKYRTHRLVWLWHHGYFPEKGLDHIDRNRLNNRINNLKEASQMCNMRNTDNHANNISGVKGVGWHKASGKWAAYIAVNGKMFHLGLFIDFTEAVANRLAHEQALNWEGCDTDSPAFQYMRLNSQ